MSKQNIRRLISGEKFGRLTIINFFGPDSTGRTCYSCLCDCGNKKNVKCTELLHNRVMSCGCLRRETSAITGKRTAGKNGESKRKFVGNLSGQFWARIKQSALLRKLDFLITQKYAWDLFQLQIEQCALTGIHLVLSPFHKDRNINTASLDRIDSSKGYVEGNVQWVHKDINYMKQSYSEKYFIELCRQVTTYKLSSIN